MTGYLASVTHKRCTEFAQRHGVKVTGPMRGVLAVMSYPVRDARSDCADADRFVCRLSWASIARDSGYDRDYIRHDLAPEMVALGLIERVGEALPRKPVHWHLKIHSDAERERLGVTDPQGAEQVWGGEHPSLGVTAPQPGGVGTPNPSDSFRPQGRKEGGRTSAGSVRARRARPAAAAPSETKGKPARKNQGKQAPPAPARRRREEFTDAEIADAVAANRAGEITRRLAERLNVSQDAVRTWRKSADLRDARAAVRDGEDPELVAARFRGIGAYLLSPRHLRSVS